jgi:hypothetical protein
MSTVILKSNSPEMIKPLIKNAIEREKRIIENSIRITKEKIEALNSGDMQIKDYIRLLLDIITEMELIV